MSEKKPTTAVASPSTTPTPTSPGVTHPVERAPDASSAKSLAGTYPERLVELEQKFVTTRRGEWPKDDAPETLAALALSGGGIRSATFCLGVLQALARRSLLQRFDFLSTVSGGGYIGSFIGAWMKREGAARVQEQLPDSDSKPVRFLRDNGRYLAPNGGADLMTATAAHLRNWFTVWLVLGTLVLGTLLLAESVKIVTRNVAWTASMEKISKRDAARQVAKKAEAVPTTPVAAAPTEATMLNAVVHAADLVGKASDTVRQAAEPKSFWSEAKEHIMWSPFFQAAGWVLLLFGVSTAVAYWFVGQFRRLWQLWLLLGAIGVAMAAWLGGAATADWSPLRKSAAAACYLTTLFMAIRAATWAREPDMGRNRFTDSLAGGLMLTLGVAVFAIIDTIGQSLALDPQWWVSAGLLPGLAAAAHWLMPRLTEASKGEMPGWVGKLVLPLVAAVVALVAFGVLSMAAHRIGGLVAHAVAPPQPAPGTGQIALQGALVAGTALAGLVAAVLLGLRFAFVNMSSHHRLYSARLTRAYLGASNPWRINPKKTHAANSRGQELFATDEEVPAGDVTSTLPDDQISFPEYTPHLRGGPLHLINSTVNETVSGISNIEARDRHGFSFAIGPAGVSVRTSDHAEFLPAPPAPDAGPKPAAGYCYVRAANVSWYHTLALKTDRPVQIELPPVGAWVGISGAAFTTGLGARTNLAFSFLLGFFNIRLGYWWDSGINPAQRKGVAPRPPGVKLADVLSRVFPAQAGLLDEIMARFHGPARRHWYLSDGGHFENCAVYELIRRRIPLIVCCDCGADPAYEFEDVANLVRKARIDFRAEIVFWEAAEIENRFGAHAQNKAPQPRLAAALGSLADLGLMTEGPNAGFSRKHAALATVTYADGSKSLLLLIKPTLTADAPIDLCHYDATDSAFPQQSTLDQFFDEAQWESYRKLGEFIGGRLFGDDKASGSAEWNALASLAVDYARERAAGAPAAPPTAGVRLQAVA